MEEEENERVTLRQWVIGLGGVMMVMGLILFMPLFGHHIIYDPYFEVAEIPASLPEYDLQWLSVTPGGSHWYQDLGAIYRPNYNDTVWLRVIEPPDCGASFPISYTMIVNETFTNTSIDFCWAVNPCVDTDVILVITNKSAQWVEKGIVPQSVWCK